MSMARIVSRGCDARPLPPPYHSTKRDHKALPYSDFTAALAAMFELAHADGIDLHHHIVGCAAVAIGEVFEERHG
jgi:hypothetical protein